MLNNRITIKLIFILLIWKNQTIQLMVMILHVHIALGTEPTHGLYLNRFRYSNDANTGISACGTQADDDVSPDIEENVNVRYIDYIMTISKKGKYRFENQKHGLRRVSSMLSRWM